MGSLRSADVGPWSPKPVHKVLVCAPFTFAGVALAKQARATLTTRGARNLTYVTNAAAPVGFQLRSAFHGHEPRSKIGYHASALSTFCVASRHAACKHALAPQTPTVLARRRAATQVGTGSQGRGPKRVAQCAIWTAWGVKRAGVPSYELVGTPRPFRVASPPQSSQIASTVLCQLLRWVRHSPAGGRARRRLGVPAVSKVRSEGTQSSDPPQEGRDDCAM